MGRGVSDTGADLVDKEGGWRGGERYWGGPGRWRRGGVVRGVSDRGADLVDKEGGGGVEGGERYRGGPGRWRRAEWGGG